MGRGMGWKIGLEMPPGMSGDGLSFCPLLGGGWGGARRIPASLRNSDGFSRVVRNKQTKKRVVRTFVRCRFSFLRETHSGFANKGNPVGPSLARHPRSRAVPYTRTWPCNWLDQQDIHKFSGSRELGGNRVYRLAQTS